MNNQFFYTTQDETLGSFNIGKVVKSVTVALKEGGNGLLVILDDGHERTEEVPVPKGKKLEMQRQRVRMESQVLLTGDDIYRFVKQTSVDEYVIPERKSPVRKKKIEDDPELKKIHDEITGGDPSIEIESPEGDEPPFDKEDENFGVDETKE